MLTRLLIAGLAAAFGSSLAFAEGPPKADVAKDAVVAGDDAAPHQDDAGRLTLFARQTRVEKGCGAAAPAYRVIAGMGEGQEAAQHELGECLLSMTGANDVETALFRQEGVFWLTRAAFAGNARAQRRLAMELASPASALHDPKGSLGWSLVYGKNPDAELYGYGPLPPTLVPGLKSSLGESDIAEAERFASDFEPVTLAKFESPKGAGKQGAEGGRRGEPPGRRQ